MASRNGWLALTGLALLVNTASGQDRQQTTAPPELVSVYREAILDEQYGVLRQGGDLPVGHTETYEAGNPAQAMVTRFRADGIEVAGTTDMGKSSFELTLTLESWGRAGEMHPVAAARRVVDGRRVEYRRGPLTEWYINNTAGLEQGFTLASPPPGGEGDAPLRLRLAVGGGLVIDLLSGARGATFVDKNGTSVASYTGLVAWDANDRDLEATLIRDGVGLSIVVEDAGAEYPITIDPVIAVEEAKLTASDAASQDRFGYAASNALQMTTP